jgi:DNA-binding SARP family transcriptional activator
MALDCQSRMSLTIGDPALAVEIATEAIALDPFRESSHQQLMQAYVAGGNKVEAARVFQALKHALGQDLGTDLPLETRTLYQELLS